MGYPVITKEQFYSKYSKENHHYINNAYKESDDSIRLYRDEVLKNKTLIFQLPDLGKEEVPEHRKNIYQLPIEDQQKLREEFINSNLGFKKVSAQLLTKFVDPYNNITWEKVIQETIDFEDYIGKIVENLKLSPFLAKAFRSLVEASNVPEKEYKHLNRAKEYIDKQLILIRKK